MGQNFTDNNGTTYVNINQCRTFNIEASAVLKALEIQPCAEVVILNTSGNPLSAFDAGFISTKYAMIIPDGTEFTLRGITNSNQVSAMGDGNFSYRTQFFSSNPQR